MFRKPKRSAKKAGLRVRKKTTANDYEDEDDEDRETTQEVREALKRAKNEHGGASSAVGGKLFQMGASTSTADDSDGDNNANDTNNNSNKTVMHHFEASTSSNNDNKLNRDLATSTTQHHPKAMESISKTALNPKRNKFLAGPIRAPTNIRTTCRFDYQPDICKDYKDTGFCGFGDTCIYLHDRGDTMSGWQLEKVWEEKKRTKKQEQEEQMERFMNKIDGTDKNNNNDGNNNNTNNDNATATTSDDGLPFACFLCRKAFEDPIVTTCGHYFCQGCLQDHHQRCTTTTNQTNNNNTDNATTKGGGSHQQGCPICGRDTHGVMNQPTKLIAKKRKLLGRKATWQEFWDSRGGNGGGGGDNE
mmetsp:Transcript_26441/g.56771  ORF Transcript_26441/g.56771 Transcript_26441/m.56771 type:complete len:360 (-) Transcript_26441:1254-2333(-)